MILWETLTFTIFLRFLKSAKYGTLLSFNKAYHIYLLFPLLLSSVSQVIGVFIFILFPINVSSNFSNYPNLFWKSSILAGYFTPITALVKIVGFKWSKPIISFIVRNVFSIAFCFATWALNYLAVFLCILLYLAALIICFWDFAYEISLFWADYFSFLIFLNFAL